MKAIFLSVYDNIVNLNKCFTLITCIQYTTDNRYLLYKKGVFTFIIFLILFTIQHCTKRD